MPLWFIHSTVKCGSQAQHVNHIVFAGVLILSPKGGLDRAARENRAVCCHMAQHDPFTSGGKQHIMFTHDIAAANGAETDVALFAGTGDAVAPAVSDVLQGEADRER